MTDKLSRPDFAVPAEPPLTFRPLNHLVIGFPDDETSQRAAQALAQQGIAEAHAVASNDMRLRMAQLLEAVEHSAGDEVLEMRRFLSLSADGYGWLVVPASGELPSARIVAIVEPLGARLAVHYGNGRISDLL